MTPEKGRPQIECRSTKGTMSSQEQTNSLIHLKEASARRSRTEMAGVRIRSPLSPDLEEAKRLLESMQIDDDIDVAINLEEAYEHIRMESESSEWHPLVRGESLPKPPGVDSIGRLTLQRGMSEPPPDDEPLHYPTLREAELQLQVAMREFREICSLGLDDSIVAASERRVAKAERTYQRVLESEALNSEEKRQSIDDEPFVKTVDVHCASTDKTLMAIDAGGVVNGERSCDVDDEFVVSRTEKNADRLRRGYSSSWSEDPSILHQAGKVVRFVLSITPSKVDIDVKTLTKSIIKEIEMQQSKAWRGSLEFKASPLGLTRITLGFRDKMARHEVDDLRDTLRAQFPGEIDAIEVTFN